MKPLFEEVDDLNNNDEFQGKMWSETVATPLGQMVVCATDRGVCLLEFVNSDSPVPGLAALGKKLHGEVVSGENGHIWQVRQELADYFSGKRVKFDVPVHLIGTEFQMSVWQSLLHISYGTTITYMEQARALGNEKAIRAVAAANGKNKVAIIIPCHRVIGTNGRLTGYAGGIERKKCLLEFEKRITGSRDALLFDEVEWNHLKII